MNYILIAVIIIVILCLFKTNTKENFKCEPKSFSLNNNTHSSKFFRFINEIPTILLIFIIFIVVFKPI